MINSVECLEEINSNLRELNQAACNAIEQSENNPKYCLEYIRDNYDQSAYYAITIKCIKHLYFASREDCIKVLKELERKHKGDVLCFTFEKDSMLRYHIHGIMEARKSLKYTLYRKPFWSIDIQRLLKWSDFENWKAYIEKDQNISVEKYFTNGGYHFI